MKSINRLLILTTIVLLSMTNSACDSPDPDIIITLYVNTKEVKHSQTEDYCYLFSEDSNPKNSGTGKNNLKDFLTEVELGDNVLWNGISSNAPETDIVKIKQIIRMEGPKIFKGDPKGNRTVNAKTVKVTPGNDKYRYIIQFTVSTKSGVFTIDPKMQVN